MTSFTILITAVLFGGMVLYSFGFATFIFHALPADLAGPVIRKAFPYFYLFVIFTSALAAVLALIENPLLATILASIAASSVFTRQILMPAINRATDAKLRARFNILHSLSVAITLLHIAGTGYVLINLF